MTLALSGDRRVAVATTAAATGCKFRCGESDEGIIACGSDTCDGGGDAAAAGMTGMAGVAGMTRVVVET